MDVVKRHFEEEAKEFDEIILRLIPYYVEMIDGMVSAIPFSKMNAINVIDLGCGTGTISRQIKENFPKATITCLDFAKNMIDMCKHKLRSCQGISCRVADFRKYEFDDSYDVVVSSLALHHLETDEEKKEFYHKIYKALRPRGIFLNADVVLGSNESLQDLYIKKWKSFMLKSVSPEEIETKWFLKYREEDRPAKLIDHLKWLKDAGFYDIDVIWKYYNFAVYVGHKTDFT